MRRSLAPFSFGDVALFTVYRQWWRARDTTTVVDLGWFPALSIVCALGLLLSATAGSLGRIANPWSTSLFWTSVGIVVLPFGVRMIQEQVSRSERICLAITLSLALYLIKILHSPLYFTFPDEFMHWRTASDIMRTGELFQYNSLLLVSPYYPGLEALAVALAEISGLGIYEAGVISLAIARAVFTLSLFLFYELATKSARIAGLATLIYMTNPNYVFFGSQFAYETLSLPLMALGFFVALRREYVGDGSTRTHTILLFMAFGSIIITHHLTTYALLGFLVFWTLVSWVLPVLTKRAYPIGPGGITLLMIVAAMGWLVWVASQTVSYLVPPFSNAAVEMFNMMMGESSSRQLFKASNGTVAPLLERATGFGSVLFLLGILPFGLWRIWMGYRTNIMVMVCACGGIAYPASLALRLSSRGAEISNRSSEFIFMPLALVLAIGIIEFKLWKKFDWFERVRLWGFPVWMTVVLMGGIIVGWAPWARVPGPYVVAADTRSIEPQGIADAKWVAKNLGPNNRIISDRTNRLLMGSYGQQRSITSYGDGVPVAYIYFAKTLRPKEQNFLRKGQVRYVIADRRVSDGLPYASGYFERGEKAGRDPDKPLDPITWMKFNEVAGVSRIFDSGDIRIHDMEAILAGP
jgi:hypothetical protein